MGTTPTTIPTSTTSAPPVPWYRRPRVRVALRYAGAAAIGAAAGVLCGLLPEEFRPLCRALAKLAIAITGG